MGMFDWLFGRKKPEPNRFERVIPIRDRPTPTQAREPEQVYSIEEQSRLAEQALANVVDLFPSSTTPDYDKREPFTSKPKQSHDDKHPWKYRYTNTFWQNDRSALSVRRISTSPNPERIKALGLPDLDSFQGIADLLGMSLGVLKGFTHRPNHKNSNYVASHVPKGNGEQRLLLAPKAKLKSVQRRLYFELLSKLPLNDSTHGFRPQHDCLSGASVHVGRDVVICMDIEEFFPSFDFRRVSGYLKALGYPKIVAHGIANLTTVTPDHVQGATTHYCRDIPQLPQGAPTSPGIANAICWRMDKRLSALAQKFGGDYTRYADDLTFSGFDEMAKGAGKLLQLVRKIVKTEGLALNEKKTRIMRKGRQQRVTGVVVNQQTNVSRRDFDKLKAILHNCIKHGPGDQNREGVPDFKEHLRGRIAHISHIGPERGRKLKAMFEQIRW